MIGENTCKSHVPWIQKSYNSIVKRILFKMGKNYEQTIHEKVKQIASLQRDVQFHEWVEKCKQTIEAYHFTMIKLVKIKKSDKYYDNKEDNCYKSSQVQGRRMWRVLLYDEDSIVYDRIGWKKKDKTSLISKLFLKNIWEKSNN